MQSGEIAIILSLLLPLAAGRPDAAFAVGQGVRSPGVSPAENGPKLVCYYTPTRYFPVSLVPSDACTHLVYAFGSISGGSSSTPPNITTPTSSVRSFWATLTSLRRRNPGLKVLLSLQRGFPDVVGHDIQKMQQFAVNAVAFLRAFGFDGVDIDWEFPDSAQKAVFATFCKLMRAAIDQDAKGSGKAALLLSIALPNNPYVAGRYDIPIISSAVDYGTAMAYDFHLYNKKDVVTGYNSPLYTPAKESHYLSASALAEYYVNAGFPASKLLLGVSTYGRSWTLASSSDHGLHAPAVGKGDPGPYRHLTGIYTYPDACVAIQQGATRVPDSQAGAVYLFHGTSWVAYDDVTTVTAKCQWAVKNGLGGVGVWAMHLDDVGKACRGESLPLIQAMRRTLQGQTRPHLLHRPQGGALPEPHQQRGGHQLQPVNQRDEVQDLFSLLLPGERPVRFSRIRVASSYSEELSLQRHRSDGAVVFMERVDEQFEESAHTPGQ